MEESNGGIHSRAIEDILIIHILLIIRCAVSFKGSLQNRLL